MQRLCSNSSKTWKITNFCLQWKLIITLQLLIIYFKISWLVKIVKIQQSKNGILKWKRNFSRIPHYHLLVLNDLVVQFKQKISSSPNRLADELVYCLLLMKFLGITAVINIIVSMNINSHESACCFVTISGAYFYFVECQ